MLRTHFKVGYLLKSKHDGKDTIRIRGAEDLPEVVVNKKLPGIPRQLCMDWI